MTYELHPLCTLFPRMAGAEFAALVADIKAHGLREPITLHDGMILDGGNRYRACVDAGVAPEFAAFAGDNLVSFVLSANLHRRHLSEGQQAAIVASAQDWAKAQPAHRPEKAGNVAGLSTVAQRASQSGASERTQRMADKVARASPDLARRVAHGEVSLPKALAQVEAKPARPPKAPARAPELEEHDDGPSAEELRDAQRAQEDDAKAVQLLLESDDKLAAAMAEIKRQAAHIRILEERVRGLTNEAAQAVRLAKSWRTKFERLEKAAA